MIAYLNQVVLMGRVGKKPEIAIGSDGKKIAKFSIATSETWKDKDTLERKEKTEWHRIVVYNHKISEIIEKMVESGALVYIDGKIRHERWIDKATGQERTASPIIIDLSGKFMIISDSKREDNGARYEKPDQGVNDGDNSSGQDSSQSCDDDMPF